MCHSPKIYDRYILFLVSWMYVYLVQSTNHPRSFECTVEEYPYQVSIQVRNSHHCGGSLVSTTWVLTAAHCLQTQIFNIYVITGLANYSRNANQGSHVISLYPHPEYRRHDSKNDIALIQLGQPIYTLQYVSLAKSIDWPLRVHYCEDALVAGFSFKKTIADDEYESKEIKAKLKCIYLSMARDDDCYRRIGREDPTLFCTLNSLIEEPCKGNSGSPFMCNRLQYGVVSTGSGCLRGEYTTYIRVDVHEEFLMKTMNEIKNSTSSRLIPNLFTFHSICIYTAMLILMH